MGRQSPKNTALARKLARLWEKWTGDDFPGGVENAFIQRDYPGRQQRAQGAMSWALYTMGPGTPAPILPAFMSAVARDAVCEEARMDSDRR